MFKKYFLLACTLLNVDAIAIPHEELSVVALRAIITGDGVLAGDPHTWRLDRTAYVEATWPLEGEHHKEKLTHLDESELLYFLIPDNVDFISPPKIVDNTLVYSIHAQAPFPIGEKNFRVTFRRPD